MHSSSGESVKHMCEGNFTSISQMHELIIYQGVVRAFYHQKVNKTIPYIMHNFFPKSSKKDVLKPSLAQHKGIDGALRESSVFCGEILLMTCHR